MDINNISHYDTRNTTEDYRLNITTDQQHLFQKVQLNDIIKIHV